MITELRNKTRALVEDFLESDNDTFTYTNSAIFTLQESNIDEISSVTVNGSSISASDYSFDSSTSKLTITSDLSENDIIVVSYNFYKYSDSEIDKYIKGALSWVSIYSDTNYDIDSDGDIYPTPDDVSIDLFAIIASILIKPNYSRYSLPNLTVHYPNTMQKEDRIRNIIKEFSLGMGVNDTLDFN